MFKMIGRKHDGKITEVSAISEFSAGYRSHEMLEDHYEVEVWKDGSYFATVFNNQ